MGEFSYPCFRPMGLRSLEGICRTLPVRPIDSSSEDVFQFEDLAPVLDEDNAQTIFDDLKNG